MGEVQKIFLQSNTDYDNIKSQPLTYSKNNALQKYPNFLSNLPKLTQGKEKLYGIKIKSTVLVHSYKIKIQ